MINVVAIHYRTVALSDSGEAFDLSSVVTNLNWQEQEKELAMKVTFQCPLTDETRYIQPLTPIMLYADVGAGWVEFFQGTVQKVSTSESNGELVVNVEAADAAIALRQSQDDYYFSPDSSSTSILEKIFSDHGIEHTLEISDVKHAKKVYRGKYLSDMISDVLKDIKEKDGGVYFLRARAGVIEIIPRGTNEDIFHFDIANNLVRVRESFDITKTATRIKVIAKSSEEGHQHVDAIIDGNLELGERTRIYYRNDKETLEEAEKAAKKLLDEQGGADRKTSIETADIPFLRKNDRIRVRNSLGEAYFFVKSIRHNATALKMTLELVEDKDKNKEAGIDYATNYNSETADE